MWQAMIVVATTLASIVTAIWFLTIILVRTTKATAEVLTAALSPPITEETQPVDQGDLLDPDWNPPNPTPQTTPTSIFENWPSSS